MKDKFLEIFTDIFLKISSLFLILGGFFTIFSDYISSYYGYTNIISLAILFISVGTAFLFLYIIIFLLFVKK